MSPDEGDLLIYGEAPLLGDGVTRWRAAAPDEGRCYRLSVDGEIRDSQMALTLGFGLPAGYFCPDETGRVTSATAVGQR